MSVAVELEDMGLSFTVQEEPPGHRLEQSELPGKRLSWHTQ